MPPSIESRAAVFVIDKQASPTSVMDTSSFENAPKVETKTIVKEKKTTKPKKDFSPRVKSTLHISFCVLRSIVVDLPLLLLFGAYISTLVLERFWKEYLLLQQDLQEFSGRALRKTNELTYYHRVCDERDLTASDTVDLIVNQSEMTPDDAAEHMMRHGASVYPNLLTDETAAAVRSWILEHNLLNQDAIPVIENEHRWSFGMRADQHPTVTRALEEVLSHPFLVQSIEKIMGRNPAVIEFTGITAAYGAKVQRYHQDVVPEGNGGKWARNFIPSYSLFIPLQNITAAMGATEVCPGSHMCAEGCFNYCPQHGFQVSGSQDNWPMGWGALVNQQLMHRGAAHQDPNGPHRVLFIVTFAPRPQFDDYQVETRSIGQGGSYSLHWTQWGHTLRDFANPTVRMQQPWRTLRSLGLYKPRNADWGWDYVTQATARISNNENGFFLDDWFNMIKSKQFSWIPERFHGTVERDYSLTSRGIWNKFYMDTLHNIQDFLKGIHMQALVMYAVLLATACWLKLWDARQRKTIVLVSTLRLVCLHGVILLLAWLLWKRVEHSCWAKNLRGDRLYQWPETPFESAPSLPATLPQRNDILVFEDMQSDFLASYTRVLDVVHPGNREFHAYTDQYAAGYHKLPEPLRQELVNKMYHWMWQQGRRILVKNDYSQWAHEEPIYSLRFVHAQLLRRSNPLVDFAVQHVDYALSECRFGYWRDTSLCERWMPPRLRKLQNDLLRWSLPPRNNTKIMVEGLVVIVQSSPPFQRKSTLLDPTLSLNAGIALVPFARRPVELSQEEEMEPDHDWINEGDQVEGAYAQLQTEWYRGNIAFANANTMTWDIQYDDGDQERALCLDCVRPFEPYTKGEDVEYRNNQDADQWNPARILRVHSPDSYDIRLWEEGGRAGRRITKVAPKDMRRMTELEQPPMIPGVRVLSRYPGYPEWFPGVLAAINSDGTFAIQYDDGDFLQSIEPRLVRLEEEQR